MCQNLTNNNKCSVFMKTRPLIRRRIHVSKRLHQNQPLLYDHIIQTTASQTLILNTNWLFPGQYFLGPVSISLAVPSTYYAFHVTVKATSHSAIFRACKYAIKDTDDVLPAKGGPRCPYW